MREGRDGEQRRRHAAAAPIPELAAAGIAAALGVQIAPLPVAVEIRDMLNRRHPPELEAAVYFCCMEAIQNAIKHSAASRIEVRLSQSYGQLRFSVRDNGTGFDAARPGEAGTGLRNMGERLRRWDGRVVIRSSPEGTEVDGEIPVAPNEAVS